MADMSDIATVWVFNGAKARFASAVFSSKERADEWITKNRLSGVLTRYPLDLSVYEWALARGHFAPSKEEQRTAEFVGRFTSASQEHYHYEDGVQGG
jgi:hypothetical protein